MILLLALLFPAAASADSRVAGGEEASIKNWPFAVALVLRADPDPHRGLLCGGSLISPRVVLTAAHCVWGSPAKDLDVIWRRRDLRSSAGRRIHVQKIRVHPRYENFEEHNDLALLRLQKPLPGPYARPKETVPEKSVLWAAGWGWTGKKYPYILHQSKAIKIPNKTCTMQFGNSFNPQNMFCAGADGPNPCSKDSGGPLVERESGRFLLFGVVSWGDIDCYGTPTVYARIQKEWIGRVADQWKKPKTPLR